MQTQVTANARFLFRACSLKGLPELAGLNLDQWTLAWQQVELAIEQHPQWERANHHLILHFTSASDAQALDQGQCLIGREIIGPPAALPESLQLADSSARKIWSWPMNPELQWFELYRQAQAHRSELLELGHVLVSDWRLQLDLGPEAREGHVKIAMELQFFSALGDKPMLQHPFA